jgi:pimeloyl-ACP methyl ester carboxylesterase
MSGYVTDLEVHHIESCGHWTQQERSGAVNEILSDWLGRVLEGVS